MSKTPEFQLAKGNEWFNTDKLLRLSISTIISKKERLLLPYAL